ncbi:MAG: glycosyltransferase family 4 protein [Candidatus Aquicultorales bacterium]
MTRVMLVFGGGDEGGGPAYLKSLLRHMDRARFQVTYVSLGRDSLAAEVSEFVAATEVVEGWRASLAGSVSGVFGALRKHKADVIHTHGLRANLAGRVAGRLMGIPVVTTVHSAISLDYADRIKQFLAPKVDSSTLSLTTRFIAVSAAIKKDLIKRRVPEEKITVVYNGVDVPIGQPVAEEARRRLGVSGDEFVVGTVARLEPNKGIRFLIRAAADLRPLLPKLKVVIVGSGRDRRELEREAERLGLGEVVAFTGFQEDARALMSAFDVFALPSLMEGFALVVIEAMASGIPVVASKVGGVPEIVQEGRNGLLVEPGDPKSLAEAILKLHASPQLRRSIIGEAYQDFSERFTTQRFVEGTERVLEEVAGHRSIAER